MRKEIAAECPLCGWLSEPLLLDRSLLLLAPLLDELSVKHIETDHPTYLPMALLLAQRCAVERKRIMPQAHPWLE